VDTLFKCLPFLADLQKEKIKKGVKMIQTLSTPLSSIQTQVNALNKSANNIAQNSIQTDLAKEMSDQIIIEKSVALNVETIKTADAMLGTLLDIKS